MRALPIRKPFLLVLALCALLQTGFSQLCTGSLGDPVASITFGGGGSPGPPLATANTSYTYTGSSCPNEGEYSIGNLSFNCFNNTWHAVAGDHTSGDANGYYMLVNASNTAADFYVDNIDGLCGGTSYELTAWVMNFLKPTAGCSNGGIDPNLIFRVETTGGTELIKFESGYIPETESPTWKQYGTFFQTPPGITTVVIRISNNSPGGCGNDLALDDIALRPCGPSISASLAINSGDYLGVCGGDSRSFLMNSSYSPGYSNPVLQWQSSVDYGNSWTDIPGATGPAYLRPPTGVGYFYYRLTIAEAFNAGIVQCRIGSAPVKIEVTPGSGFVQCTNYVFGCYGSTVPIFASGGSTYRWSGPNGFTSNLQGPEIPNIQFEDAGVYTAVVTNIFGCAGSCSTTVVVYPAVHALISQDALVCEGTPVQLSASGGTQYIWDPNSGLSDNTIPNPIATPKDPTRYKVTIVKDNKCFDTASVFVDLWRKPTADAGRDRKMLLGLPILLDGKAGGTDVSFTWTPANYLERGNSLRPSVNPPVDEEYYLEVRSNKGCGVAKDTVLIKVFEKVKVPNTFTPNGDGYNDVWQIELLDIFEDAAIEVYNTSGQLVYRSIGYNKPWDGTRNGNPLPVGTYYYVFNLKVENAKRLSGYVTILR